MSHIRIIVPTLLVSKFFFKHSCLINCSCMNFLPILGAKTGVLCATCKALVVRD